MIKQTLYFSSPAYLSLRNKQLVVRLPEVERNETLPDTLKEKSVATRPVEDIGLLILDHQQITVTHGLLTALLENNVAVIHCNEAHHPVGMMLNLDGHTLQTQRFKAQVEASEPLKKQLWQQTVVAKIENQAAALAALGKEVKKMEYLARSVKSGDADNCEARAAAYYWSVLFSDYIPHFVRGREEAPPNNLLNYGYAILRGAVARALVGSGLLPTLGIFHRNQYNAYCLADDVMEPYRPFVDRAALACMQKGEDISELSKTVKSQLLSVMSQDTFFGKECSPLMVGLTKTTASLSACFEGKRRKITYPVLYVAT
ncbi:MAG: type II CRISPR-associated endonuclease Cas1 [Prevotellaceae bacterium]|jgi:CRISPR-associated protein Cas1|nr:type II CRISPR-associated endonuclease Cas1 [Prevotellaceae bacterium]